MPGRLICYTAAACIDRYLRVPQLGVGRINRPHTVTAQAGGKGINVARTARVLGAEVSVVGHASDSVRAAFADSGIPATWSAAERSRECLVIFDESSAELTEFYEPVLPESPDTWPQALEVLRGVVADAGPADVLTISGRMPAGWPVDALAELVSCARSAGADVWLDTDDTGLAGGLRAEPGLVKINHDEAAAFVGGEIDTLDTAVAAARTLRDHGARAAIITLGNQGCVHVDEYGGVRHQPTPTVPAACAVGSGDAFLAGFAAATLDGLASEGVLELATAAACATARRLVVGDLGPHDVDTARAQVPAALRLG